MREPGWYWVRQKGCHQECAKWNGTEWLIVNFEDYFFDSDFEKIGPKIEQPKDGSDETS